MSANDKSETKKESRSRTPRVSGKVVEAERLPWLRRTGMIMTCADCGDDIDSSIDLYVNDAEEKFCEGCAEKHGAKAVVA